MKAFFDKHLLNAIFLSMLTLIVLIIIFPHWYFIFLFSFFESIIMFLIGHLAGIDDGEYGLLVFFYVFIFFFVLLAVYGIRIAITLI